MSVLSYSAISERENCKKTKKNARMKTLIVSRPRRIDPGRLAVNEFSTRSTDNEQFERKEKFP